MKISIITVTLDAFTTIMQTVHSVLGQKNDEIYEIEYIIVDGLSTDGTWDLINNNLNKFTYVIHEKDSGLYDAMNKGIAKCSGDIVGIINSDDWYEEDAFSNVVDAFKNDPKTDIVYGDMTIVEEDGTMNRIKEIPVKGLWVNMIAHPTVFVRRELYERWGGFSYDFSIASDYELILRFWTNGAKIKYLNKNLAYFRTGGISKKRRIESAHEVSNISYRYVEKSPDPPYFKRLIEQRYYANMIKYFSELHAEDLVIRIKKIIKSEQLTMWGLGKIGKEIILKLKESNIDIPFVVDKKRELIGERFEGIEIFMPEILMKYNGYLLVTTRYIDEIEQELIEKYSHVKLIEIDELMD